MSLSQFLWGKKIKKMRPRARESCNATNGVVLGNLAWDIWARAPQAREVDVEGKTVVLSRDWAWVGWVWGGT